MAGLLDGLDIPKWMTPQEWSVASARESESIGRNVSGAVGHVLQFMGMANETTQAAQGLALKKDQFNQNMQLQRDEFGLAKQKQEMVFEAQQKANRDTARLQGVMQDWNSPDPNWDAQPETPYETAQGASNHAKFRGIGMASSASGKAELAMNERYAQILTHDQTGEAFGELKSLEDEYGKNSKEWRSAFSQFGAKMDQEKAEAALKLRTASAEVAGQYRLMTGEQTAETKLALEGLKNAGRDQSGAVQAQPLLLLDGSVDPDHVIVRSGNANKIIHVQDKDKFKALTAPQQISSLRTVISANNMLLKQTTDEKEQAGFRANIIGYTKDLDNLLKGSGKGSAAPSVGKTLKWNPDTNDFE